MPEARAIRSTLEAAEQAAAAGDYTAAERFLSDVAVQQEESLGPLHHDLANTLNNLGVVYEATNKPAEAERCYRRAYAIAIATLQPDHPFVATSEKNLREFCAARGLPFEPPTAKTAAAPGPDRPEKRSHLRTFGVLGALALVALIGLGLWSRTNRSVQSAQSAVTPPPLEKPAPVPESLPVEPIPLPPKTERPSERAVGAEKSRRPGSSASAASAVREASLCRDLSTADWRCEPPTHPVNSGRLFFYTRVTSVANTTIEHRWYHGARLHQAVELDVRANQGGGYRTYSRTTVTSGDWRVELRSSDGAVLHEERFVVR